MAFIIPISTMVYATVGGLKATFTTSYMHTVIIFVVCLIFMFVAFLPNSLLGGIDDVSCWPSSILSPVQSCPRPTLYALGKASVTGSTCEFGLCKSVSCLLRGQAGVIARTIAMAGPC